MKNLKLKNNYLKHKSIKIYLTYYAWKVFLSVIEIERKFI